MSCTKVDIVEILYNCLDIYLAQLFTKLRQEKIHA